MHPLRVVGAASLLLLAAPLAAAQLVDVTPPGRLVRLIVETHDAKAEVEATLAVDDDVTQARLRFVDRDGAELARHYIPAGPGETVQRTLPLPLGAAELLGSVTDGEGNRGPETTVAVDGRLASLTVRNEAPGAGVFGLVALAGMAAVARRR